MGQAEWSENKTGQLTTLPFGMRPNGGTALTLPTIISYLGGMLMTLRDINWLNEQVDEKSRE